MLKIRRSFDRLIFDIWILIPGKVGPYIETGPLSFFFKVKFRSACVTKSFQKYWHSPVNGGLILGLRQWETVVLCNDISHWLVASLESVLKYIVMGRDHEWRWPGAGNSSYPITMTSSWARWRLKSPASRFTQWFVQAQIKENITAPRHWPLWGEFTADRWIPHTKGQ